MGEVLGGSYFFCLQYVALLVQSYGLYEGLPDKSSRDYAGACRDSPKQRKFKSTFEEGKGFLLTGLT